MNREVLIEIEPSAKTEHLPEEDVRKIQDEDWAKLAKALGVDEAALRAVAEVESAGSGFLPDCNLPKILFEGHAFYRLTGGRFNGPEYQGKYDDISYPEWDRSKYGNAHEEWKRLEKAAQLNRAAALQSASWGMFQVMGFNYALCGYYDVEALVADQHKSATAQLNAFARFIARPAFVSALKDKDWATFARLYNGKGYKANKYDTKMRDAYKRIDSGGSRARASASAAPAFMGRASFEPVKAERRRARHVRNVRPDPVDLRDWDYRPAISIAPPDELLPMDPRPIKQQNQTNACVGFALATVVEYLLDRAGDRPAERISGFMIYSMARRYDEWDESEVDEDEEEKEEVDDGSSLRGALKGWSKHGACCERMWEEMKMPPATNEETTDWWLDAVKRPMGAYYRISPKCIRDMHIALREVGVVYASAFNHSGWEALMNGKKQPPPLATTDLPVIERQRGARDQGHAFAIVGYTRSGFIVQNSWGEEWGRGGFAVLQYDDWLENAMDCWVVQLGVVTDEHAAVARGEESLRTDKRTGKAIVSRNPVLADHEINPFVIDMENEGHLSTKGRFRTDEDDLKLLVNHHLKLAAEKWGPNEAGVLDVAIYAHGGLNDEEAAAASARVWVPYLYSNKIFPIFLMWETGAFKTIYNIFEDAVRGETEKTGGARWDRVKENILEWKNARLEGLARLPGRKLWNEMKQNANALSIADHAGVVQLLKVFRESPIRDKLPPIRIHLIGHSAGAIVHNWVALRALKEQFEVSTISLLAPAVRMDVFHKNLGEAIVEKNIRVFIAHLTDTSERDDGTCSPYGHSLLYLVSRSFEDANETPLLGMERHIVATLPTVEWAGRVRRLTSPGGLWKTGAHVTRATTHGGMDDDEAIREAVTDFIKNG
jgi:hypothetical protein